MRTLDKWLLGSVFIFTVCMVILMGQWAYMFKIAIQNIK